MNTYANAGKAAMRKKKIANNWQYFVRMKYLYLLCVPGLLYLILFHYVPMYGIIISFRDFSFVRGIFGSPWVGLVSFERLFTTPKFFDVFINSISLSFLKLILNMPVPIILALMINEIRHRAFKRVTQTIMYLPHFISWVAIGGITITFLSETEGIINLLLKRYGAKTIPFLSSDSMFRGLIVGTSMWKEAGWGTIIYLAGLSAVSPELYEAAVIDGANRFQKVWHISLPGIASTISILLILNLGSVMNNGFEQIYMFQNHMNLSTSEVFETYIYKIGLQQTDFSYSTAVGLFKSVVNALLVLCANKGASLLGQASFY